MSTTLAALGTVFDLALVILGFGLIIALHELGHFLAARWAGIRVLTFAIGMGPPVCSWRKGMGLRRGSGETEYTTKVREAAGDPHRVPMSPTEYRLNWLPLGGYVKMLGQEDFNPGAVSEAPDSYQSCKPWKRMVVISAGVVANLITAAVLFVVVFLAGLKTEAPVIGAVYQGKPASRAVTLNGELLGVLEPGLRPGDEIVSLNGRVPQSFNDLTLATAMARRGSPVRMTVRRTGIDGGLDFEVRPEVDRLTGLLEIGVEPARAVTLETPRTAGESALWDQVLARLGLSALQPGMRLVSARDAVAEEAAGALAAAARASGGRPVDYTFEDSAGRRVVVTLVPKPELQVGLFRLPSGELAPIDHLLGLTPVMTVGAAPRDAPGFRQGLRDGDVFTRIGPVEYPSLADGMAQIRAHKGRKIKVAVVRQEDGATMPREFECKVRGDGTIGFVPGDTADSSTLLAMPPGLLMGLKDGSEPAFPPAAELVTRPGLTLRTVAGDPVANLGEVREAMRRATGEAHERGQSASLLLQATLPRRGEEEPAQVELAWSLSPADLEALHGLGWQSPIPSGLFTLLPWEIKASGPVDAIKRGVAETRRVMATTYLTFARLFEGTVKISHLKGPVGIAHVGTVLADRGFIWLLFFLALISVNLAVINFLPLPIVDGGQFIFLVIEQIRGRPAPMAIQNAATVVGLVLIGSMFLIVTFQDVLNLFGR